MDPALVSQLISVGAALLGAVIGAFASLIVARYTSKRSQEVERQKEQRAQVVKATESASIAISTLYVAARVFARAATLEQRTGFLKKQQAMVEAHERAELALMHLPKQMRDALTLPVDVMSAATNIGSYSDTDGTHPSHPLTIIDQARQCAQSIVAGKLLDEDLPPLPSQVLEYETAIDDYAKDMDELDEHKGTVDNESIVYNRRVEKFYSRHPEFRPTDVAR